MAENYYFFFFIFRRYQNFSEKKKLTLTDLTEKGKMKIILKSKISTKSNVFLDKFLSLKMKHQKEKRKRKKGEKKNVEILPSVHRSM